MPNGIRRRTTEGVTLADLLPSLRTSLASHLEHGLWPVTAHQSCAGTLTVGGVDTARLAAAFGTPVIAFDVSDVRERARCYRDALPDVEIAYAAKAFLCRSMARLVEQERLSLDVCSGGEIALAGTHTGLTTGTEDQEFGLSVATGDAARAVARVLARPELDLVGLHCHIGSQVRSIRPYTDAARAVVALLAEIARVHRRVLPQLDLGGGHAVAYAADEHPIRLAEFARTVPALVRDECGRLGIPAPQVTVEPGRALVARAGVTIYRVGAVKHGLRRTFVAVDGGMSDDPRPALYGVRHPVRLVGRPAQAPSLAVTVVGRHCEPSDVIAEDVLLPADVAVGELLAVPCSGAYHASPASTYNHVGRPPVVAVASGAMVPMLRRETVDGLPRRDAG